MPDDPVISRVLLINEPDVRLVKLELGDGSVEHVLETRDGIDAMGADKWRKFEVNGTALRQLFKFLIRFTEKEHNASS